MRHLPTPGTGHENAGQTAREDGMPLGGVDGTARPGPAPRLQALPRSGVGLGFVLERVCVCVVFGSY